MRLALDEILALGAVERAVFLQCISNNVAGRLMGNALWSVVPLERVLARAGLDPAATTILAHGSDGYTRGFQQTGDMCAQIRKGGNSHAKWSNSSASGWRCRGRA